MLYYYLFIRHNISLNDERNFCRKTKTIWDELVIDKVSWKCYDVALAQTAG